MFDTINNVLAVCPALSLFLFQPLCHVNSRREIAQGPLCCSSYVVYTDMGAYEHLKKLSKSNRDSCKGIPPALYEEGCCYCPKNRQTKLLEEKVVR